MSQVVRRKLAVLHRWTSAYGFDFYTTYRALANTRRFWRTLAEYRQTVSDRRFTASTRLLNPVMTEFNTQAGSASGHYFHQDLWAASKIYLARPPRHVDVGSRIDGFVAHLLTFMPVEVVDIRPLESQVSGLNFIQEDATTLSRYADGSVESISSLHAVEHFGLGRYGDLVNPDACFIAMAALARVLRADGRLYFSVPIGVERVEFNSHRVFAPQTILSAFSGLRLVSFAAVDDNGHLREPAQPEQFNRAMYACGLFEFAKVNSQ